MKIEKLQQALVKAARNAPEDDRVPYAFEKRVMARLREAVSPVDPLTLWNRALWRAVAPCMALTLAVSAWFAFTVPAPKAAPAAQVEEPPLEFQQVLLAPLDDLGEIW